MPVDPKKKALRRHVLDALCRALDFDQQKTLEVVGDVVDRERRCGICRLHQIEGAVGEVADEAELAQDLLLGRDTWLLEVGIGEDVPGRSKLSPMVVA